MMRFRRKCDEGDPEPECDLNLPCLDTDDLIKLYVRGQIEALGEIWRRHYRRMLLTARFYLRPHLELKRLIEADDLLNETAARLTRKALSGGLTEKVGCQDDFWLLFRNVLRRCVRDERERFSRLKRGGEGRQKSTGAEGGRQASPARHRPDTVGIDGCDRIAGRHPSHEFFVWTEDVMRRLFEMLDEEQHLVASLRLSDLSIRDIAVKMEVSERTIARRLEEIRDIWGRSGLLDP